MWLCNVLKELTEILNFEVFIAAIVIIKKLCKQTKAATKECKQQCL